MKCFIPWVLALSYRLYVARHLLRAIIVTNIKTNSLPKIQKARIEYSMNYRHS